MPRRLRHETAASQRPPGRPPRPAATPTHREFGAALRKLRKWAGLLRLKDVTAKNPRLRIQTISDYELGKSLSDWNRVYDYLYTCLVHPEPPRRALTPSDFLTECEFWSQAWTYANQHPTEEIPEPEITADDNGDDTRKSDTRRRVVITGAVTATTAVGGLIVTTAIAITVSVTGPGAPAPQPQWPVIGEVAALSSTQGIDLDSGKVLERGTPGVDVSFSENSSRLDTMGALTRANIVPERYPPFRETCNVTKGWAQTYPDVYSLTEGRNICIYTDQSRPAMLTITRRATPETGTIGLRFTTWES